jgi:hypothetical protein
MRRKWEKPLAKKIRTNSIHHHPFCRNLLFYCSEWTTQGPYTISNMQEMIVQGKCTHETLVWKQGIANWIKAAEADDLKTLFGAAPPPLPKS